MPILCACVPAYKVEVARHFDPALRERPTIVADRLERGRVLEVDAAAYELGARSGMTVLQAVACAGREAALALDDLSRDAALWAEALDSLDATSPLVEDAGAGVAFLEMRGITGTPRTWLTSARDALNAGAAGSLPFRFGLGPNKFVARMAAQLADGTVVPPGAEREFVAPLPLHAPELGRDRLERLRLLGVRTLGELAALPHGPFVRRFGPDAATCHARACGRDDTPLIPRPRALRIDRTLFGEGSAEREEQVLFALRTLVARVAGDLAYAGKRCGSLRLHLECEDGEVHELPTGLAQPTAQAATLFDLLRARLEGVALRSPVTGLRLGAERLEEGGSECSLFAGAEPDPEAVAVALARLDAALGPGSALRARLVAGNRFETRFAYDTFDAAGLVRRNRLPASEPERPAVGTLAYRVLRPHPVGVRIERGRPAQVAERAVLEVAGPWRVDETWWTATLEPDGTPYASDAYDVLLDDGSLWRIVSEGGAWYVRGTYD